MEERANLFGFTIPTSLFHEQTTGTSVSLDNTAVRLPLASDRSAWGHAATAVTEGCPPICCLTRVIYTHEVIIDITFLPAGIHVVYIISAMNKKTKNLELELD